MNFPIYLMPWGNHKKVTTTVSESSSNPKPKYSAATKAKEKCLKSLTALYLEVPSVIAEDVKRNVLAALEEAEENGKNFARYCNQKGWLYRQGIGNWYQFHTDQTKTTDELYNEWLNHKTK